MKRAIAFQQPITAPLDSIVLVLTPDEAALFHAAVIRTLIVIGPDHRSRAQFWDIEGAIRRAIHASRRKQSTTLCIRCGDDVRPAERATADGVILSRCERCGLPGDENLCPRCGSVMAWGHSGIEGEAGCSTIYSCDDCGYTDETLCMPDDCDNARDVAENSSTEAETDEDSE